METFKLGERALVLRGQMKRRKIEGDVALGALPNGCMICRDVGIGDIGAADFVEISNAPIVSIGLTAAASKFLLREKDIVLSYVGMIGKVGQAGFVRSLAGPALAGRSLCIVRGIGIDPVWLFYYLLQRREKLIELAPVPEKYRVSVISLGDLRKLEIPMPTQKEIDAVNVIHAEIAANAERLAEAGMAIAEGRRKMNALFAR